MSNLCSVNGQTDELLLYFAEQLVRHELVFADDIETDVEGNVDNDATVEPMTIEHRRTIDGDGTVRWYQLASTTAERPTHHGPVYAELSLAYEVLHHGPDNRFYGRHTIRFDTGDNGPDIEVIVYEGWLDFQVGDCAKGDRRKHPLRRSLSDIMGEDAGNMGRYLNKRMQTRRDVVDTVLRIAKRYLQSYEN